MKKNDQARNPENWFRKKGDSWNVSRVVEDPVTRRRVRHVTRAVAGEFNEKPTFDIPVFASDGTHFVFWTACGSREHGGTTVLCKCRCSDGEITQLTDPVPGFNGWSGHILGGRVKAYCTGINGAGVAGPWAVYTSGPSLRKVQLETLEDIRLASDFDCWAPCGLGIDPAGTSALISLLPMNPDVRGGCRMVRRWWDAFAAEGGMRTRLLRVPLNGDAPQEILELKGLSSQHNPICPTDSDLVLQTRDLPPLFAVGGDGLKSNRYWIWRISTGHAIPIGTRNANRFQIHALWSTDGNYVFYDGRSAEGGCYVGVSDRSGNVVREYDFHEATSYGHVGADPRRPNAMVIDGFVTPDLLQWVYWDDEAPRFEPIARHATNWGLNHAGIYDDECADPHPQIDPTGHWLVFNVGRDDCSDICLADIGVQ